MPLDIRQGCCIVREDSNCLALERLAEMQEPQTNRPKFQEVAGKRLFLGRPTTGDKLVVEMSSPTLIQGVGPEEQVWVLNL